MSGIEFIVGTVLAAVPLALETYDRSGRVFEVFSVFKQFPREVTILEAKLGAQRTIFRNNAIHLLTTITRNRVKVQEVANQPSSYAATAGLVIAPVYQHRVNAVGESFVACRQTAERIHDTLQKLCFQSEAFKAELGEKQDNMSASDWLKYVKTRFKLGLNKPQIAKAIEELRNYNNDFNLIVDQITKSLQEILNEQNDDTARGRKTARSLNMLQRYYRARYASKALYSTLQVRWMCSSHRCHSFDMRILDCDLGADKTKGKVKASSTQFVTCELAIAHDGSSYASKGPLRLEIEQACESDDEDENPQPEVEDSTDMQQLARVLETNADRFKALNPTTLTTTKREKIRRLFKGFQKDEQQRPGSSVPIALPNLTQSLAGLNIDTSQTMTFKANSPADLSLVDDFCNRFHEAMTDSTGRRSLLGSWKQPQAQWFCVPVTETSAGLGASQSLSELIRWIAAEPVLRSLPRPLLVELAGNVAEGIMQFYSTPWLASTDLGKNVRYYNNSSARDNEELAAAGAVQLKGPYFKARLASKPAGSVTTVRPLAPVVDEAADFTEARNKLLFNFGVLLLEIGYGQPWCELKRSVARAARDLEEKRSDYRVAMKLAQLLINQMGPAYPRIIKKCLGCDFGLGETDLDDEDLQRQFLLDVVSGLQQLKENMREMKFAPPTGR